MKETKEGAWRFAIFYAVCLLLLLLGTVLILFGVLRRSIELRRPAETEAVYVYLSAEAEESLHETETKNELVGYLVKEHHGQIGIFSADGKLLEILETYVKTLPEADRTLLGEGISVMTREELNALIEDYSH